jgi:hypothetical protein
MRHLKQIIYIGFIGLFFSCSDSANLDDKSQVVQTGATVQTEKGGKFTFNTTDNSTVDVQVLSISDSRCPMDAVCIWEGNAKVGFQIADLKSIVYLCLLQNMPDCKNEAEVSYDGKTYTLTLLGVTPYPSTANSEEKKVVEFTVKQKN